MLRADNARDIVSDVGADCREDLMLCINPTLRTAICAESLPWPDSDRHVSESESARADSDSNAGDIPGPGPGYKKESYPRIRKLSWDKKVILGLGYPGPRIRKLSCQWDIPGY